MSSTRCWCETTISRTLTGLPFSYCTVTWLLESGPSTFSLPEWRASEISRDRKSTRLNSSHTEIYTLSLHDALPISYADRLAVLILHGDLALGVRAQHLLPAGMAGFGDQPRSEEHTSELQSHRDLHSFPTRRSSDLVR